GSGNCDTSDTTGEQIFVDALDVLNRHWPGPEHKEECDSSGDASTNLRYCSEAGVNTYEDLVAEALGPPGAYDLSKPFPPSRTDLIAALNEFANAATYLSTVYVQRGPNGGQPWTGAQ